MAKSRVRFSFFLKFAKSKQMIDIYYFSNIMLCTIGITFVLAVSLSCQAFWVLRGASPHVRRCQLLAPNSTI